MFTVLSSLVSGRIGAGKRKKSAGSKSQPDSVRISTKGLTRMHDSDQRNFVLRGDTKYDEKQGPKS